MRTDPLPQTACSNDPGLPHPTRGSRWRWATSGTPGTPPSGSHRLPPSGTPGAA